ncbi:hypothetical protein N9543_03895 [Flavobacteriaceae bacterium]|nr:hypothetical protein [Flavobacteriaceae bacterium]
MKKLILLLLFIPLVFSCSKDNEDNEDTIPLFNLISDVNIASVGTPYLLTWTIGSPYECQLSGAVNKIITNNGSVQIIPEKEGEQNTIMSCGSKSINVIVEVLPEFIDIPDVVFSDALTRLGHTVVNGKMKATEALKIKNFIITSMNNFYGDADSNGTTTFENSAVPDYGANVAYTLDGKYITDTSGIESFRNLETMRLERQQLEEIDLSTLKNLSFLSLWRNPILNLDLSGNTELTSIGLSETGLTNIDTSKLTKLVEAAFQHGRVAPFSVTNGNKTYTVRGFSSLDFSKNTELQSVYLNYNPLTDFGIGQNNKSSFRELWATNTNIKSLNLSGFSKVDYVILNSSKNLTYLNLSGINNDQVPSRLFCEVCPNLNQIIVTNPDNYRDARDAKKIFLDDHISFTDGS